MDDWPLSRLLPDDPRNRLSTDARRRVDRAHVEADAIRLRAEVDIKSKGTPVARADSIRGRANLKAAKHVLGVLSEEYGKLCLSFRDFSDIMHQEIEGAVNSLELSGIEQRLLQTELLFPPPSPMAARAGARGSAPKPASASAPMPERPPPSESIAEQLNRLRQECRWTVETLAEKLGLDTRSVERHLAGKTKPRLGHVGAYERVFSKAIGRTIVISQMPVKRR
jgi:hypothetical protein